jgi:hypothetical protein
MPAQAVQDLNAQSRDGRRPTVQSMGLVRRVSHASPIDVTSESDRVVPLPRELLVPSPPSVTTNTASILPASDPTDPTADAAILLPHASASTCAATSSVARPCNIEVGPAKSLAEAARGECDPPLKPHDSPDAADEDEYQTLPEELPHEEVPE